MTTDQLERVRTPEERRHDYLDAERAKWLTVEEAAYVLSTSKRIVFRMIAEQALPVRRDGRLIRIHIEDLRPRAHEALS